MSSVPERGEIDEWYKWDTDDLFVDDSEWEESYETAESLIEELDEYEGRITEDAETLLSALHQIGRAHV